MSKVSGPILVLLFICSSCVQKDPGPAQSLNPVPFTRVSLIDSFWLPRILKNTEVTIPIAFRQSEETGRIRNFEVAGGLVPGSFCSIYPFDDSDVFKIMEGASYSLMIKPDLVLEAYLDTLIHKISLAQEPDGYLYTNRTILGDSAHEWAGTERWQHVHEHSHELYNVGHMYEAAVAHHMATGKTTFLDIAIKNANLVYHDFGWGKIEKYPGHQEIEIGLVKLYRATGDERYLELARFFLDVRGPDGWEYNQAHKKVVDQMEPVGHAVRSLYMLSGMADVGSLQQDGPYMRAVGSNWSTILNKKIYVTGGIGQSGGNEGFGPDYELPNMSAYCETCASIAFVFLNHRLFLETGDATYIDVMERTMYNALLSGVSLSGDRFFYPNPLESNGQHQRQEWFGCACCPSNMSRFLPSVPGYVYGQRGDDVFVNLYIANQAKLQTPGGLLSIAMETDYPWDGKVSVVLDPEQESSFRIHFRIPAWTRDQPFGGGLYAFRDKMDTPVEFLINGEAVTPEYIDGNAALEKTWQKGDRVEIRMPMPVRRVIAHDSVEADKGRFSLQRGPLVYCLEGKDQAEPSVRHVISEMDGEPEAAWEEGLLNGIMTLQLEGRDVVNNLDGSYTVSPEARQLKAIPYAYWANRGPGQMLVWIPYDPGSATPAPAPTIAHRSAKSSSGAKGDLECLSDQYHPLSSNDHSTAYVHWWPLKDTTVWLAYDFAEPARVSSMKVYWFDDGPDGGCRIPERWRLLCRTDRGWEPVRSMNSYNVTKDEYDLIEFEPVTTNGLKLEITLSEDFSGGVHEWSVGQ